MTARTNQTPWEFLLSASRNSLQNFELSRLSQVANLRKEIAVLLNQCIEENTAAMLARCLLDERERAAHASGSQRQENGPNAAGEPRSASDNFFADRVASKHGSGDRF
jgi:hypothetical protein